MRSTLTDAARKSRMGTARATIREVDDNHLMQEVKKADVYHSETPTDFERWQMVGLTSVPLKQDEDKDQKAKKPGKDETGDWNHDQPKGDAAEALMIYLNGQRSHPVALVDDRRVRPYKLKEGDTALYAASGSGQMILHNDAGTHIIACDNPRHGKDQKEKERYVSLRHVKKAKQSRKIKKGGGASASGGGSSGAATREGDGGPDGGLEGGGDAPTPDMDMEEGDKHEGDEVYTEIRATAKNIEIRDGDKVVASYDKENKAWAFSNFKKLTITADDELNFNSKKVNLTAKDELNLKCTDGETKLDGKPVKVNGGGPSTPPFTVPG